MKVCLSHVSTLQAHVSPPFLLGQDIFSLTCPLSPPHLEHPLQQLMWLSEPSYRTHHSDLGQSDRNCWPRSGCFHDSSANGSGNHGVVEPELGLRGLPDVHGRTHRLERLVVHYSSMCDRWHNVPVPHGRFIPSISSWFTGLCSTLAPTEVCEQVHLHTTNKVRSGKSDFRKCFKRTK